MSVSLRALERAVAHGIGMVQRARCTARAVPLLAVRAMPGSALPSDVSPGAI